MRGQSQSQWEEGEGEMEGAAKRVCGGESWTVNASKDGEGSGSEDEWEGGWVMSEMEGLEERGVGIPSPWEREMFWWGGGEAHRRKREREWDKEGWEEWEMTGGDTEKGEGQTDTPGIPGVIGTRELVPITLLQSMRVRELELKIGGAGVKRRETDRVYVIPELLGVGS